MALKADLTELSGVAFTGNYDDLIDKLEKSDTLEGYGILVDNTPTERSTRPVTSSGIKEYIDNKIASMIIPHGMEVFTSSGMFTVPAGVTTIKVRICGGGGGGGGYYKGDNGGTSSFGTYLTATPGTGGGRGSYGGTGSINNAQGFVINGGGNIDMNGGCSYLSTAGYNTGGFGGGGYCSGDQEAGGGGAGYVEALIQNLSAGNNIQVTIGPGGKGGYNGAEKNGRSGICIVEW